MHSLAAGQLEENTATDVETAAVQTRVTAPVLDTKLRKSPHSVDMSDKPVAPMDMTQRRWMFVISHMDVFITGIFCLNRHTELSSQLHSTQKKDIAATVEPAEVVQR